MECGKMLVLAIFVSLVMSVARGVDVKGLLPCSFPAIYNFGDSNSDTGGYSAAFWATKPAGRASDGRLIIDFLVEQLRLPYLSSYLDSLGSNYSHGANFAFGGATIRWNHDNAVPFNLGIQITQFDQFKARITNFYDQGKNMNTNTNRLPRLEYFSKALYTIDIGQNDAIKAMFYDNPQGEIPDMLNQLAKALQHLYRQGGRTFWIHNMGPIGCLPPNRLYNKNRIETFDQNGCTIRWNRMAMDFNKQLKDKVIKLRRELPEAAITYVDVYAVKYGLICNAKKLGFAHPLKHCSSNDEVINGIQVKVGPCKTPSKYINWDGTHYTEVANHLFAKSILNGSLSDPPLPITHACHKHVPKNSK